MFDYIILVQRPRNGGTHMEKEWFDELSENHKLTKEEEGFLRGYNEDSEFDYNGVEA